MAFRENIKTVAQFVFDSSNGEVANSAWALYNNNYFLCQRNKKRTPNILFFYIHFLGHRHLDGCMHRLHLRRPPGVHPDQLPLAEGEEGELHQLETNDPRAEEEQRQPRRGHSHVSNWA